MYQLDKLTKKFRLSILQHNPSYVEMWSRFCLWPLDSLLLKLKLTRCAEGGRQELNSVSLD